jgi:hypothetical protein
MGSQPAKRAVSLSSPLIVTAANIFDIFLMLKLDHDDGCEGLEL